MVRRHLALAIVAVALLGACVPGPTPTVLPVPSPTVSPVPPARPPGPLPGDDVPVELARRDLAQRLGVEPQAISVVRSERLDWPSTALGCPEPGRIYAQVITAGYRIVFAHGGKEYTYHTDRGQRIVLCTR